jgi:hypothetical protein
LFFADVLIIFIIRAVIQLFRSRKARSWPVARAEVTTAEEGSGGCLTAELTYKYKIDGELYTGTHTEPFLWAGSVKSYLEQCSPGGEIVIRVKPGTPESSVVRDRDLYFHAHGYRLDS